MREYYDRRAPEYDDCYLGLGGFDDLPRPGDDEVRALEELLQTIPPARTLDVACGTGFLTRHLRGDVVGLDQCEAMLEIARRQRLVRRRARLEDRRLAPDPPHVAE